MKKFLSVATIFAACMLISNLAMAVPVFQGGSENNLYFQNVENIYRPTTGGGLTLVDPDVLGTTILVGDVFRGIMHVQNNDVSGITIWNEDNVGSPIDTFTGYFLLQVASISPGLIGFSPYSGSDPSGVLSGSEVMALYTDEGTVPPHTRYENDGTFADDLSKSIDGTLWATLGITDGAYWYAFANADFAPVFGNTIAEGFGGLNFIQDFTGLGGFTLINDPNEGLINTSVEMYFQTEIERASGTVANAWDFISNDPATFNPVPEPATMLLLGSGLLGLAGLGRKKLFKKG